MSGSLYFSPNSFHFNYSIVTKEIVICQAMSENGKNIINNIKHDDLNEIIGDLLKLHKEKKYEYSFIFMDFFEFQIIGRPQFESILIEISKRLLKEDIDEFDGVTVLLDD